VFLSRLFLKALLETRNDVLARSVRDACADERAGERGAKKKSARTVVAILGAAHLNGVQARLLSGRAGDALEAWEK
jgi:pheromone shutdown protein TraB